MLKEILAVVFLKAQHTELLPISAFTFNVTEEKKWEEEKSNSSNLCVLPLPYGRSVFNFSFPLRAVVKYKINSAQRENYWKSIVISFVSFNLHPPPCHHFGSILPHSNNLLNIFYPGVNIWKWMLHIYCVILGNNRKIFFD